MKYQVSALLVDYSQNASELRFMVLVPRSRGRALRDVGRPSLSLPDPPNFRSSHSGSVLLCRVLLCRAPTARAKIWSTPRPPDRFRGIVEGLGYPRNHLRTSKSPDECLSRPVEKVGRFRCWPPARAPQERVRGRHSVSQKGPWGILLAAGGRCLAQVAPLIRYRRPRQWTAALIIFG